MNMIETRLVSATCLLCLCIASPAFGQLGATQGVKDVNTVSEAELTAMPHLNADIVKAIVEQRPFASITELHKLLTEKKLSAEQATELYRKAFVHINLNTATSEEILLVPGAGKKMAHEFDEYRPWKTWAQFEKEIGKYVGKEGAAALAQFCFIPMNANEASDEALLTIPGADAKTVARIKSGRPWKSADDLIARLKEASNEKEARRIARYLTMG